MSEPRHPVRYFITKKVRQHYARILASTGYRVGEMADPMVIFPKIRSTIHLSPRAAADLLSDERRLAEEVGTFWLSTDGRLLWVIQSMRVISVIELTGEQTATAIKEHGMAMRARDSAIDGEYDPARIW